MKTKSGNNIGHTQVMSKGSPSSKQQIGVTPPFTTGSKPAPSSSKKIGITPPHNKG